MAPLQETPAIAGLLQLELSLGESNIRKLIVIMIISTLPTIALAADGNIGIFHEGEPVCGVVVPCGESVMLEVCSS